MRVSLRNLKYAYMNIFKILYHLFSDTTIREFTTTAIQNKLNRIDTVNQISKQMEVKRKVSQAYKNEREEWWIPQEKELTLNEINPDENILKEDDANSILEAIRQEAEYEKRVATIMSRIREEERKGNIKLVVDNNDTEK